MKKYILVLSILVLTFTTACGQTNTELNKFKSYLEKEYNYKCSKSICKNESKYGPTTEIDFNANTIMEFNDGSYGLDLQQTHIIGLKI